MLFTKPKTDLFFSNKQKIFLTVINDDVCVCVGLSQKYLQCVCVHGSSVSE